MLRIAVCDDDKTYLGVTTMLISEYGAVQNVHFLVETFSTPSAFLDQLDKGEQYDIYLLDVYMPGLTGMRVATELRRRNDESPIVFLTSSHDHAIEAFGLNATHYVLKPYTKDEFFAAMDKAMRSIQSNKPKTILMKTADGYYNIPINKINYCESDNHNQRIFLLDKEPVSVRTSSVELWGRLSGFEQFYLCGKTFIINLEHIERMFANTVEMANGDSLNIPRRNMASLKNAYLDYLGMR